MSQNTAGIITSTPVHECNPMPDWEAEILGIPREDHKQLVLQARRECGNAHPQQMFDVRPRTAETIGIVFVREVENENVETDARDIVTRDVIGILSSSGLSFDRRVYHITWRATDQYAPGRGMFPAGLVVLRADGQKQFRRFEEVGIHIPTKAVNAYVEGLPSTSY